MMSANNSKERRTGGRPLLAIVVAACIAAVLASIWLEIAEAPLVGQPVLYAGGMILLLSPIMWLGFFLVLLPSLLAAFRPEGKRFTAPSLVTFVLLPFGCVLLIPGIMIVAGQCQEKMQNQVREWQRQQDDERVTEIFEQGGDLRQFRSQSPETQQALSGILGKLDASQLHLLTPAYIDHPNIMQSMAYYSTNPEDLRAIFSRYKQVTPNAPSIMTNLAQNNQTPPDVLVQLANARYGYISLRNPNFPVPGRLKILQGLIVGNSSERYIVADSPYATAKMLEKLASDADPSVRSAVAQNTATPLDALEGLTRDKEAAVRDRATRGLHDHHQFNKP